MVTGAQYCPEPNLEGSCKITSSGRTRVFLGSGWGVDPKPTPGGTGREGGEPTNPESSAGWTRAPKTPEVLRDWEVGRVVATRSVNGTSKPR